MALALSGCAGELTSHDLDGVDAGIDVDAGDDLARQARESFDTEVLPLLDGFCAACHTVGALGFMQPQPDVYATVMAWPSLVDVATPADSRLLSKGEHEGPAWTVAQTDVIRAWIDLEADAAGIEPVVEPETDAFSPIVGINTIDLTGVGLAGATLTFRAERLQVGLYLSELMVNSGPDGAHIVHPLFVRWIEGVPAPDPVDRFADVDMSVDPLTAAMIGGGTVVLVDLPPNAQLSVHFKVAEPTVGGTGPIGPDGELPGGCRNVAGFTESARAALSASCAGCHAGSNTQATNATDMTSLDDLTPAGQASACAQILSRVNLADPALSGIFIAPDPNSGAGHPFKFGGDATAFAQFRTALLAWIALE